MKRPFLCHLHFYWSWHAGQPRSSYVTLTSSANPIRKGQSATLSCTTFYSDGTHSSCVSPVYTDDQSQTVVKISGNTISANSIGSATVKVTVTGVSATLAMKVHSSHTGSSRRNHGHPGCQSARLQRRPRKRLGVPDGRSRRRYARAFPVRVGNGRACKRHHLGTPSPRSVMRCSLTASPHTSHLANTICIPLWLRLTARRTIPFFALRRPVALQLEQRRSVSSWFLVRASISCPHLPPSSTRLLAPTACRSATPTPIQER